jgi:hypothetical protein
MKFPLPKKYRPRALMAIIVLLLVPLAIFSLFLATAPGTGKNPQLFDFGQGQ